jgi:shikimate kinase
MLLATPGLGMEKRRIFLVGFMGAGKSTVGSLLAGALGWEFIDLDHAIEREQGRAIAEIFATEGEPEFRRIETARLNELASKSRVVVALGGGAFVQESNRARIAELGTSIFLDCRLEVILARCPNDGTRPLFKSSSQLRELFALRLSLYRQSDLCIDVSEMAPPQIVQSILEQLGAHRNETSVSPS